jgi:hypothetical protein
MHVPDVQVSPAAQTVPHFPQLLGSLETVVSQPFDATLSQSAKPALHVNPHVPPVHVAAAAFAGVGHALPHEPQLLGVEPSVTSQPFEATWSQSPNPPRHVHAQFDDAQNGVAFGGVVHALLHAPQFAGSNARFVQLAPHRVVPPVQTSEHALDTHDCPPEHWLVHVPQ